MDPNQSLKIRGIIRILGCLFAAGAIVTAFLYRAMLSTKAEEITGICMVARICAIAMFVAMAVAVVVALVSKSFAFNIDGVAFVAALLGFIGNFIVAPGSTVDGIVQFEIDHLNYMDFTFDATQLQIGAYMIMLGGIVLISITISALKGKK